MPLLDAIPQIRRVRERSRYRPRRLFSDRGYDHDKYRHLLRARGTEDGPQRHTTKAGLGKIRCLVQRT
ncbi:hypothetical protein [Streptomyces sp. NPDC046805]|uniref:hypothetical protein n=1 Tax=Streptomyces sp. NPDC046805 TaxID=3155134 RepID=UPI0033CEFB80